MGQEETCRTTFKGKTSSGKARLETDVLHFRAPDLKLTIPFKDIQQVTARGETLAITFPGGTASFDLGVAAAKWANKILHPPSRLDKLGVKPDWRASAIGVADQAFLAGTGGERGVSFHRARGEAVRRHLLRRDEGG